MIKEQPAIGPDRTRKRNAGGHQKRWPVNAVEACDFLADKVQIRRPEFFKARFVLRRIRTVTERRDVVGQRVKPHVDHVLLVAGHGNAPRKTCAADRQIPQSSAHKGDHLAARRLGAHEAGIGLVKLQQLALKGRELEEIILLAHRLRHATAIGADRAGGAVHIQLIADTVLAGV